MSDTKDVISLLRTATSRYRSVRAFVYSWEDLNTTSDSESRYPTNPRIGAVRRRGGEKESVAVDERIWRVWLDRPFHWRVERFWPLDRLLSISGGNRKYFWGYDASSGVARATRIDELPEPEDQQRPHFNNWIDPIVSQLLDPRFMFEIPPGGVEPVAIEVVGEATHIGRTILRATARISDWATRDTAWSDNMRVADDYELAIDAKYGILLRVAARIGGKEFSYREVFDLAMDQSPDASMFELRPPPGTSLESGADGRDAITFP